ncbi:MAG TPA: acetoacetate--CoA ligase [Acidimicrobiia bacterium]|nr:acetoacetate--CoA ligase [Acidimicrobiia bacterium]
MGAAPSLLWQPPADAWETSRIGRFLRGIERRHEIAFANYEEAWRWSIEHLPELWSEIVDFFSIRMSGSTEVLNGETMPGAKWFAGARLNYVDQALGWSDPGALALIARSQTREQDVVLTAGEMRSQVAAAAAGLRDLGVGAGDRVVAYLPNIPECLVAFLACASLGAIWSSCPPEFGIRSVVDRFRQIEPKVLLAVDGYRHRDQPIDRGPQIREIIGALPTLEHVIGVGYLDGETGDWPSLIDHGEELEILPVDFDHPLYVLYSSGTTGLPKPIVHGHGGITLEHCKALGLQHGLGAGDRFAWYSTTGWMMWNLNISGLLVGSTVVVFDGDPSYPDMGTLWKMTEDFGITTLGASAGYVLSCLRADYRPRQSHDLSSLQCFGSTGSPLPAEGFRWLRDEVGPEVKVVSTSGGTDVCTAFVGGSALVPVWEGEISCRYLGMAVEAFDEEGNPVVGETGELVITKPAPSMPVGFWNDPEGSAYRAAYFDTYPGVWRHGDWIEITPRGSCIISGRSDATLNRGGVRMGTAEFYSVVEAIPGVQDSLVVHVDDNSSAGRLVLLVVAETDHGPLTSVIQRTLREELSPRHVPDMIHFVASIPRTVSGKKMELPVKKILQGQPIEQVANPGAMANPDSLSELRGLVH